MKRKDWSAGWIIQIRRTKNADSLIIARELKLKEAAKAAELVKRNQAKSEGLVKMVKLQTHKSDSLKNK